MKAINRALEGSGPDRRPPLLRLRASVSSKPSGYSFLPELADSVAEQISIEAAQPRLDLGVLRTSPAKTIILGVIASATPRSRKRRNRGGAHPRGLHTSRPSG